VDQHVNAPPLENNARALQSLVVNAPNTENHVCALELNLKLVLALLATVELIANVKVNALVQLPPVVIALNSVISVLVLGLIVRLADALKRLVSARMGVYVLLKERHANVPLLHAIVKDPASVLRVGNRVLVPKGLANVEVLANALRVVNHVLVLDHHHLDHHLANVEVLAIALKVVNHVPAHPKNLAAIVPPLVNRASVPA